MVWYGMVWYGRKLRSGALDLKVRGVQERLVSVSMALILGSSKPQRKDRATRKRLLEEQGSGLDECLREAPHLNRESTSRIKCTRCNKSRTRKLAPVWLRGVGGVDCCSTQLCR